MSASVTAFIDPSAIAHNLAWTQHQLRQGHQGRKPFLWSVVKANAYGHGLAHILPALKQADGLAVLGLGDAIQCRELGWPGPLLVMRSAFLHNELTNPRLGNLHLVLDNVEQLAELSKLRRPSNLHAWIRHAGTLNHTGFQPHDYPNAFAQAHALVKAGLIASARPFLHPARGEHKDHFDNELNALAAFHELAPNDGCAFNSAALLTSPRRAGDANWVRSGILLYGVSPLAHTTGHELGLRAAMTLKARIYAIQNLQAGSCLGYGSSYQARQPMRIGLVSCGYADGYPRHATPGTPVLVGTQRASLLGTVSMDLLAIDLTGLPQIHVGSWVTLWGNGLPVEEIARHAGTIAADLLTNLTAQVKRQVHGDDH